MCGLLIIHSKWKIKVKPLTNDAVTYWIAPQDPYVLTLTGLTAQATRFRRLTTAKIC